MSPLPRNPAQGDAAKLGQLATGLKQEHGTYGATVQKNLVGRSSTGQTKPQQQSVLRPEHKQVFDELAKAEVERQRWAALAAESPTPWVLGMQNLAERNYQEAATKTYNVIPNIGF